MDGETKKMFDSGTLIIVGILVILFGLVMGAYDCIMYLKNGEWVSTTLNSLFKGELYQSVELSKNFKGVVKICNNIVEWPVYFVAWISGIAAIIGSE